MESPCRLHQRLERRLKSLLQLLVADNEATLLIPADQSNLLFDAGVQLVETCQHVC